MGIGPEPPLNFPLLPGHSQLPAKDHRVGIDLCEVEMDAINQFLLAGDADTTQHVRAILLNMVSTIFSQEPCFGVKTNSNRCG